MKKEKINARGLLGNGCQSVLPKRQPCDDSNLTSANSTAENCARGFIKRSWDRFFRDMY